ncbi:glycosyl hydrolase family 61-domain-containing protein [Mycena alexandri]|uniref:lytic cellulose monooxygenase (C4-dehydrogenating) n=1 Tax=Mycena alexandri TaxID=1745969 RepID=A0AAD6SQ73_9AGAR|nr:glycosyl hydrolase family 61-domain-containing protein [Mycena alexandri]
MAKAPSSTDVASWDGSGAVWFKIYEIPAIADGVTITFPATGLSEIEFTIPSALPSGQYLIRTEHIALHNASYYGGAQFYIACAQVQMVDVTSTDVRCYNSLEAGTSSTATVAAGSTVGFTVSGGPSNLYHPGVLNVYMAKAPSGTDVASWDGSGSVWFKEPGILIDIYYPIPTNYTQASPDGPSRATGLACLRIWRSRSSDFDDYDESDYDHNETNYDDNDEGHEHYIELHRL